MPLNLAILVYGNTPDKGNLRETFFIQNITGNYQLSIPNKCDILVNDTYLFEIGGKSKTKEQIRRIENAYIVKDDIEIGVLNTIPLWIFGFLY
ncbi:MAG: hypothetical protein JSS64_14000 [Bacteroidetes bacterium]|nr:hypothetical protein [Bacteroidota bacterium]